MAVKTRTQLVTAAETIRDESEVGANTALRVGSCLLDIVDSMPLDTEVDLWATAVSTINVATLSGITTTLDGKLLDQAGVHKAMLTGQSDGTENGPWVVQDGPWTRPVNYAAGDDAAGVVVGVQEGTIHAESRWQCTSDSGSAVVDTDATSWRDLTEWRPGASDDDMIPYASSQALAYSAGLKSDGTTYLAIGTDGSTHIDVGPSPASSGTLRFSDTFSLVLKDGAADRSYTFEDAKLMLPADEDVEIIPEARSTDGAGKTLYVLGAVGVGTDKAGGLLSFKGGNPTGAGADGGVEIASAGSHKRVAITETEVAFYKGTGTIVGKFAESDGKLHVINPANDAQSLRFAYQTITAPQCGASLVIGLDAASGGSSDGILIQGGATDTGNGGAVNMSGGTGPTKGGDAEVAAGQSAGIGGNTYVKGGANTSSGAGGHAYVRGGTSASGTAGSAKLQTAGGVDRVVANDTGVGFFAQGPVAQPADPGALTDATTGSTDGTVQALTDPADTPASADALRDDLVNNLIPELRNNFAELTAVCNALRNGVSATGGGSGLFA